MFSRQCFIQLRMTWPIAVIRKMQFMRATCVFNYGKMTSDVTDMISHQKMQICCHITVRVSAWLEMSSCPWECMLGINDSVDQSVLNSLCPVTQKPPVRNSFPPQMSQNSNNMHFLVTVILTLLWNALLGLLNAGVAVVNVNVNICLHVTQINSQGTVMHDIINLHNNKH